jgi:Ca-activated chloride channel homolog
MIVTGLIGLLAGVSVTKSVTIREHPPQDIMIVFDLSLSMLAEDVSPSRIQVAREVVRQFVRSRESDRMWLIVFAGRPFVSVPFSTDRSGLSHIVAGLSPYLIRQDLPWLSGTNIGDALLLANMTHSGWAHSRKSIVLITDGKSNIGIDPIVATKESLKQGIRIYPIGIGSLSGAELSYTDNSGIRQYFSDGSGGYLRSDLDEPMMRQLAEITEGTYFHADDRLGLQSVFGSIDRELSNTVVEKTEEKHINLGLSLLLWVIFSIIVERWWMIWILRQYRLR